MSGEHDVNGQPGDTALEPVAVIGMALRFPGAVDPAGFWRNLRAGVESVRRFTDDEIVASGVDRAQLADPRYVKSGVILDGIERFAAAFFGVSPREAEVMDPAQRFFMECAWEALESAGHDPAATSQRIGVFAGSGQSTYLVHNLLAQPDLVRVLGGFEISLGTDKDFVPMRVSYKLGLTGPSVSVNTACSTSLVAVHLACQSLLTYQSDMALAGGVTIRVPQSRGYLHQEGGILSPDGHCRAFDARAQGTVEASGCGVVVLKRLADALADGDTVYAVIKGSAVNNDGAAKVGFTAPSVDGQTTVIAEALSVAGVPADTIGYVEAHGTGTPLGDPVEIEALTRAFRPTTSRTGFCALGSVKTNVGHLDTAAGVAGLIKTVLALHHRELPPSLHFEAPNPLIDFARGPFVVNAELRAWPTTATPRRACVSAFGIGGTNAHVVLEEAPPAEPPAPSRRPQLLVLSARTEAALEAATDRLAARLAEPPSQALADVAHTLARGRRAFRYRRVLVADGVEEAARALAERAPGRVLGAQHDGPAPRVVFMFPGQGAQTVGMGLGIYESEPLVREIVDGASERLRPRLGLDLRDVLYPRSADVEGAGGARAAARTLQETAITQPALFVVEYALARLYMSWGVTPAAMIGHSVGEYVAACLAEVFAFEDALDLVAARGRLMAACPRGAMLAVALPEAALLARLGPELSLAAVNGPALCVASGPHEPIAALRERLEGEGVACRPLRTSHAFHSASMDGAQAPFAAAVAGVERRAPRRPFVSNLTGTWITAEEATSPEYWARHLRATVRFEAGLATLLATPESVLLEVGPGGTLANLVAAQLTTPSRPAVLSTLGRGEDGALARAGDGASEVVNVLGALGRLWLAHVPVDWAGFYAHETRRRVPLPTYPFERQRYWIDRPPAHAAPTSRPAGERDVATWFSTPVWTSAPLPSRRPERREHAPGRREHAPGRRDSAWVILLDAGGLGAALVKRLRDDGGHVTLVRAGAAFRRIAEADYALDPAHPADWDVLLTSLHESGPPPDRFVSFWPLDGPAAGDPDGAQRRGLYGLLFLAQALGAHGRGAPATIDVVSVGLHAITGREELRPELATLLGPVLTIPKEYPHLRCRSIDLATADDAGDVERLLDELSAESTDALVAYRGGERKTRGFESVRLGAPDALAPRFRRRGVYLITGGLGGIGLTVARWLAERVEARLVLLGRSATLAPATRQALEASGAQVLVLQGDVADGEQMRGVIARAREQFGPINGVIHTAGVPDGALIHRRTVADVDAVLAPKVRGTLILDELLSDAPLDVMVLCSSLASIEAPLGQVAYTAANAFLDAFAAARRARGSGFTVSVNWDSWAEVGMAVVAHRRLIESASRPERRPLAHPLFAHAVRDDGRDVYVSELGDDDWVLGEHRLLGQPTLPATAYLELAIAAFTDLTGEKTARLDDFYFLSPLTLDGERRREIHTVLSARDLGYDVAVTSRLPDGTWVEHARGTVAASPGPSAHEPDISERAASGARDIAPDAAAETGPITTGRRWKNLRSVTPVSGGAIGVHELPGELAEDVERYRLHPALLDAALNLLAGGDDDLPFSVRRLTAGASLPPRVWSRVRRRGEGSRAEFDVAVFDERGVVLVEIEGYGLRKLAPATGQALAGENYGLDLASPGILESFRWGPRARRAPGPDDVEIEVMAAGLNFKEVLFALGMFDAPDHQGFGLECAGRVTALGPGVSDLAVGDEVLAFADASFARFTTTPRALVARIPARLTFEEAAAIPTVFMTAYYALVELARLAPGERVLIHAAAGGVGLAAIQVARWRGARILATAGSPEKREFLRSLGVEDVFDSRTLAFADEIPAVTEGRGVDVVLNSLGGEFIPKSLALLAPFGRFVEIGRRDIDANMALGLKPFDRSLAFFSLNVGPEMPRFGEAFRAIVERFEAGDFHPLPARLFPFARAAEAFGHMAQSRHIGKIVLVPATRTTRSVGSRSASPAVAADPPEWIRPAEGLDALRRILGADLPQVLVSPLPIAAGGGPVAAGAALDQAARPQVAHPRPPLETEYVAPRNETEERVAEVWRALLGLQTVGVHDDFFALGGHSLLGVQAVAELRRRFAIDLPISVVFDCPTIERLSERIGEVTGGPAGRPAVPAPRAHGITVPLSHAQHGLWFFHQLHGASAGYNLSGDLRLGGPLDVAALERAIGEIVARHEILRTTFPASDGVPIQAIHPAPAVTLPLIDLAGTPAAQRDAELTRLAAAHVERPFDLEAGPLYRVALVRLGAEAHVLLVAMHHIVADGWSMGIFVRELTAIYRAFASGRPSPLPPLPLQYADFALWQRDDLRDAAVEAGLAYWRRRLAGAPTVLDLPTDRPRASGGATRGRSESFELSAAVTARLKALSLQAGTTPFTTLTAAFGALLGRYSGQTDVLIGSPVANRPHRDLEPLIGLCINTVPLRIDLAGNPTFRELLARVRTVTREAFERQDLPFEKLVEDLKPRRDAHRNPLVQVLFALQNVPLSSGPEIESVGLTIEPIEFGVTPTAFDLMLTMVETPEGLTGTAIFDADLFERGTIALMLSHLRVILAAVAADPERPVLEIGLPAGAGAETTPAVADEAAFDFGDAP